MTRKKYPREIKRKNIEIYEDEIGDKCYKVKVKLNEIGENLVLVSDYPRRLDDKKNSTVLQRALKYICENFDIEKIKSVTILNLFLNYNIKEKLNMINKDILMPEILNCNCIIYAWGENQEIDRNIYNEAIMNFLRNVRLVLIDNINKVDIFKIGNSTKNHYPKHVLAWRYNDSIIKL